ncbi:DNA starvation/stationary phase protection protein [Kineobactrum sediminis]|uniref:DNA starvation/stationary phase protection protein n=1 Tax=Kineobactrum sediminis TaxID=1905677 RepID=A0A2N5Y1H7_9GAMM|nr:DNA starvation/stationary phase protection protein [Kineobactrum sediminis]PLW82251.1 DNA starvation/stationary phase protection protein [Kineobactrum sediminis]
MNTTNFTVPGMSDSNASKTISILGERMIALIDLALTLKHIHWNVVGPNFIAVHKMLDPQVDAARAMVDEIAERIATLGGEPVGTPAAIVERRSWNDYSLGKALVNEHLAALDVVYNGVNEDSREAIAQLGKLDPVSEDMMIGYLRELELAQWFVRAHLESADGKLPTSGVDTLKGAAKSVD